MLEEGSVPFSKYELIKQKMTEQYHVPDGTFGIEFEYLPVGKEDFSTDEIVEALEKDYRTNRRLQRDYEDWLDDKRKDAVRYFKRSRHNTSVSDYDESYGPMSPDDFPDLISEPDRREFDSDDDYEAAKETYEGLANEVAQNFKTWQRREFENYTDEFFKAIAERDWDMYISSADVLAVGGGTESLLKDTEVYLSSLLPIKRDDRYDKHMWTIGEDGPNIEIRSPILRKEQMDQVNTITAFVNTQETSGGTGLHIHIGVPANFNAFDLLAMTTLVDEKQVEQELSAVPVRRELGFAKLREGVAKDLINKITAKMGPVGSFDSIVMTNADLLSLIGTLDRYLGTNIKAFSKYKTVEFRYFGAKNTKNLPEWINYFLLLPHIAQKRNRIVLHSFANNQKIYAVRMPGNKVQIEVTGLSQRPTIKPPQYPASEIRAAKEEKKR